MSIESVTLTTAGGSATVNAEQWHRAVNAMTIRVPADEAFDGADFLPAPELDAVLAQLVSKLPRRVGSTRGRQQEVSPDAV